MILRKCRIENPASSAAVGMSKNIFVRAGLAVGVSVNIILLPPFRRVSCIWLSNVRTLQKESGQDGSPRLSIWFPMGFPEVPFSRRMNVELCQEADKQEADNVGVAERREADLATFCCGKCNKLPSPAGERVKGKVA